jgi:hypothetical protein
VAPAGVINERVGQETCVGDERGAGWATRGQPLPCPSRHRGGEVDQTLHEDRRVRSSSAFCCFIHHSVPFALHPFSYLNCTSHLQPSIPFQVMHSNLSHEGGETNFSPTHSGSSFVHHLAPPIPSNLSPRTYFEALPSIRDRSHLSGGLEPPQSWTSDRPEPARARCGPSLPIVSPTMREASPGRPWPFRGPTARSLVNPFPQSY